MHIFTHARPEFRGKSGMPGNEYMDGKIVSGLDWFPTNPNITDQLLKGAGPGGMAHKVHLDGYNILPYLGGKEAHSPRKDFFYFDDERHACGCAPWRLEICLLRTACAWGYEVWSNLPSCLRVPTIYNLRMDPYERAKITSDQYDDWQVHNAYLIAQSQIIAAQFLTTF